MDFKVIDWTKGSAAGYIAKYVSKNIDGHAVGDDLNGQPATAHRAVNKVAVLEGRENASVAWDHYCKAQGGVSCGRDVRIKLTMITPDKLGRYGDDATPRPVGVETTDIEAWPVPWMPGQFFRRVIHWQVESSRHVWEIVRNTERLLVERSHFAERAQPAQPWPRVNNCTNEGAATAVTSSKSLHRPYRLYIKESESSILEEVSGEYQDAPNREFTTWT